MKTISAVGFGVFSLALGACWPSIPTRETSATASGAGPAASSSTGAGSSASVGAGGATTGDIVSSSSGAGGGDGGAGNAGGAMALCGALDLAAPVLDIADTDADATQPALVLGGVAESIAVLVHASSSVIHATGPMVRVTSFRPWATWPPAVPPAVSMTSGKTAVPGVVFAAAPLPPTSQPRFALLHGDSAGVDFTLSPLALATGDATLASAGVGQGDGIGFFEPNASRSRRLGLVLQSGGGYFGGSAISTDDSSITPFPSIGCATTPIAAGAASAGEGWLVGLALGAPSAWNDASDAPCWQKYPGAGPASTIYLGQIDARGNPFTPGASIDVGAPVVRVRLAPRSDGAWLVFSTAGDPLRVARIDAAAAIVAPPLFLGGLTAADEPSTFAVGAVDDDLLVASIETIPGGASSVVVRRIDDVGSSTLVAEIPLAGAPAGELTMAVAPTRGALVSWSEGGSGATKHSLRVARFGCDGAP